MSAIVLLAANLAFAQGGINNERMDRDIEVAENALATMIRQQFSRKNNNYFPMEVKATYTPGYGVTMRLPGEYNNFMHSFDWDGNGTAVIAVPATPATPPGDRPMRLKSGENVVVVDGDKVKRATVIDRDSARAVYYDKIIQASKDFLADYGDLLSQLPATEKIMITNRGEGYRYMYWDKNSQSRRLVTVEATKSDIQQFKQDKINREQMMSKIRVVNTESVGEVDTDLEIVSSIFARLYRSDLAKTYYADDGIYYERLKDFGVIYYMTVVSSQEQDSKLGEGRIWRMPTQRLSDLDQAARDKKVTELYPAFEKELKDNIAEYARTKSLGAEEMVVFNVRLTKCEKCGIPSTIELSVKNNALKEYSDGKITKDAVIGRVNVKKGPAQ